MSKRLIGYGVARGFVDGLTSVRGIALASILGAQAFGVWLLFRIILRYVAFAGLGMQRGIEFGVASSDEPRAWGKAGVALVLAIFVPVSLCCLAAGALWRSGPVATGLIAVGVIILANRAWTLATSYLRGSGKLRDLARLEIIVGLLQLVLVVLLAFLFGVAGAFAGMFLGFLTGAVLFFRAHPLPPKWDTRRSAEMIRVGFPVTLSGLLLASFSLSDRMVVGALLGVEALGLYGFAIAAAELGQNLANVTRTVVLPDIYSKAGKDRPQDPDTGDMHRVLTGFAIYVPVICGYFALVIGPVVASLAPEYMAAVPVAQIYLFVAALHGLSILATLGVVAQGRQSILPVLSLTGILLNVALSFTLIRLGGDLALVALAAMISHCLHALAVITVSSGTGPNLRTVLNACAIVLPVFWCVAVAHLTLRLFPADTAADIAAAAGVFTLAVAPLSLILIRDVLKRRRQNSGG